MWGQVPGKGVIGERTEEAFAYHSGLGKGLGEGGLALHPVLWLVMCLFEKGTLEADASDNQSLSQATALQKKKKANKTKQPSRFTLHPGTISRK